MFWNFFYSFNFDYFFTSLFPVIKLKIFTWANPRLKYLICMNWYWFNTNSESCFSIINVHMYPRLKIVYSMFFYLLYPKTKKIYTCLVFHSIYIDKSWSHNKLRDFNSYNIILWFRLDGWYYHPVTDSLSFVILSILTVTSWIKKRHKGIVVTKDACGSLFI